MIKRLDNRGTNILTENLLFIILNFIFLSILIIFLVSKVGSAAVLEEKYAKQIAMVLNSAKPIMEIHLNMKDAFKKADKNHWPRKNIVSVNENVVVVKLSERSKGYSYSFFNDIEIDNIYPLSNDKSNQLMRIKITGYKNE
jgi:hypothetical protein